MATVDVGATHSQCWSSDKVDTVPLGMTYHVHDFTSDSMTWDRKLEARPLLIKSPLLTAVANNDYLDERSPLHTQVS